MRTPVLSSDAANRHLYVYLSYALWDCAPLVCGGEGGAGGGVPLGAGPALSWCGEVCLGGKHIITLTRYPVLSGYWVNGLARVKGALQLLSKRHM